VNRGKMRNRYAEEIKRAFRAIIDKRGIDHLIHFTDIRNLESILENGILSRKDLEAHETIHGLGNGDGRWDGNPDASCCSVQYPDWELYNAKQRRSDFDYAFLILSTDIILDKRCAFYPSNASGGWLSKTPVRKLSHSWAFEDMFKAGKFNERGNFEDNQTTNPSAEVHVFGTIEPHYIEEVVIENDRYREIFLDKYSGLQFLDWPW